MVAAPSDTARSMSTVLRMTAPCMPISFSMLRWSLGIRMAPPASTSSGANPTPPSFTTTSTRLETASNRSLHSCSKSSSVSISCKSLPATTLSASIIASSATVSVFIAPRTSRRSLKSAAFDDSIDSANGFRFSHQSIMRYSISEEPMKTSVREMSSWRLKRSTETCLSSKIDIVHLEEPRSRHMNLRGRKGGVLQNCIATARVSFTIMIGRGPRAL
mmetsp:Transcript_50086/g.117970  ORF Transcript_50086/g.117970 Transcript_50086/m.117970 type:complete len:217 (-) Transcript_50086:200-850(-)